MKIRTELMIQIAGLLIAGASIFVGLKEYIINNERDFRKNIFDRQTVIYEKALSDLGTMKTYIEDADSLQRFREAFKDFKSLYYGELNLYQDPDIESVSDTVFDEIVNLMENYNMSAMKDTGVVRTKVDRIQDDIYLLAEKCNHSLHDTYQVSYGKSAR